MTVFFLALKAGFAPVSDVAFDVRLDNFADQVMGSPDAKLLVVTLE